MRSLTYVTGNTYKFEVAKKALKSSGIDVVQEKLETPEIQSTDVAEVASYSAKWAANKLGKPAALTDTGYYIEALNGFPGPYIKYANLWLSAEDFLRLMEGKENRKAEVRICLAYCEPNREPVTFLTQAAGTIALKAGQPTYNIYAIDRIFIPEGFDKVDAEIPKEEMMKFWAEKEGYWQELAKYLTRV